MIISAVGFVYGTFFPRDFQSRTTLYTIFLFAIAWVLLSKILSIKFIQGKSLLNYSMLEASALYPYPIIYISGL